MVSEKKMFNCLHCCAKSCVLYFFLYRLNASLGDSQNQMQISISFFFVS